LNIVKKVAKRYGFAVQGFNSTIEGSRGDPSKGLFSLSSSSGHNAAPVTSSDDLSWEIFSGTIKYSFADLSPLVIPSLMIGATDTGYFWDLSDTIYRFGPSRPGFDSDIHAINERATLDGHIDSIGFYYDYVRNLEKHGLDL
jgi:Gly-Xaa carboxypeptidase